MIDTVLETVHKYMAKGILDSNIREDGGPDCYDQIPKLYHVSWSIICIVYYLIFMMFWSRYMIGRDRQRFLGKVPNFMEKFISANCFFVLALTFYNKLSTGKGFFIFNPCHFSLFLVAILLILPTSKFTLKLHTSFTGFLFGAILALGIPHLYGITQFEVYLYYYEHILIIPIGVIALYRRYGFLKPGFKDHMACFGVFTIYQLSVLVPIGLFAQVNLNFSLCHSPADPFYPHIGYHYFTAAAFVVLNIFSILARYIIYLLTIPLKYVFTSQDANKSQGSRRIANQRLKDK